MIRTGIETCSWSIQVAACWDCGFESRRCHCGLTLVSVVYCLEEVSAMGRSLVQSSPTDGVCMCVCVCARAYHSMCSGAKITLYT